MIIYGKMSEDFNSELEDMKALVKRRNWLLVEGIADFHDSNEGLLKLSERLSEIDIILIYHKFQITDEFNQKLLYEIARNENVSIIEYHGEKFR